MAPEVFFTVCYRSSTNDVAVLKSLHRFEPAILQGYCRRLVSITMQIRVSIVPRLDLASLAMIPASVEPAMLLVLHSRPLTNPLIHRRVDSADYPGITPDPNHEVRGMYVTGLTEANMLKLDYFEGPQYERKTVEVRLLSKVGNDKGEGNVKGKEAECEVYVFNYPEELEDREWDYEEFRSQKMKGWTRADYGFEDTDHLSPQQVDDQEKNAAVCK